MTTVYLYYLLSFERFLSHPSYFSPADPTYILLLAFPPNPSAPPQFHLIFYPRAPQFLCSAALLTVPPWVLFSPWYVSTCCSGAPPSTSAFLGIARVDGIRSLPLRTTGICPCPYTLLVSSSFQIPSLTLLYHRFPSQRSRVSTPLFHWRVSISHTVITISSFSFRLATFVVGAYPYRIYIHKQYMYNTVLYTWT